MRLFTYGTLTSQRRLEDLIGHVLPDPVEATLKGFRLFHAPPLEYPLILPDPTGMIQGLLWDVKEEDLRVLDHYEGCDDDPPQYFRQWAGVESGGETVRAQVYVGNPLGWPMDRLHPD